METNWLEFIITGLIGYATWELRQLRRDVAGRVDHRECNRRMNDHAGRLGGLESAAGGHRERLARLEGKRRAAILLPALALFFAGCSAVEHKAVGLASGVDALKIETSGSVSSGTLLPNIVAGGAVNAMATAPVMEAGAATQVVFVRTRRNSLLGELFGIDCSTEALVYIGTPNETPEATRERFDAFAAVSGTR